MSKCCPVCGEEELWHYEHGGDEPPEPDEAWCDFCGYKWTQMAGERLGYDIDEYIEELKQEYENWGESGREELMGIASWYKRWSQNGEELMKRITEKSQ